MRRFSMIYPLLVVLIAVLAMGGCGKRTATGPQQPAAPAVTAPAKQQTLTMDRTGWPVIVAFGDSLTFGQGVNPGANYPSQLQAELDRQGYKYRVVNAGISGDTTAGGLARVANVLKQKPDVVILELGANDGLHGKSVADMRENLASIIEQLQEAKVKLVLAGMQIPPNYGPEYTQAFQQTFEDVAKQYQVPLIPFFLDGAAGRPELNMPDGIHPTAEGYVYVVKNVMPVLEPLLQK